MEKKQKTIIVMGVCGSGKTTIGRVLASEINVPFLDADDFHSPANKEKMQNGIPLTDEDRTPWLFALRDELAVQEKAGGCVLACSALRSSYRTILAGETSPLFVYLKAQRELIQSRMLERKGHYMNPNLVQSQFETLEEPDSALIIDASLSVRECVKAILEV